MDFRENFPTLEKLCLETICRKFDDVFEKYFDNESNQSYNLYFANNEFNLRNKKYRFKQKNVFLHQSIAEKIIEQLSRKKLLNDATIALFTAQKTNLRRAYLRNASLSAKGLSILKQHKIVELDCHGVKLNIKTILSCLSDWSLEHLEVLDVSMNTFKSLRHPNEKELCKLKNLRSLNAANSGLNQFGLKFLSENLLFLEQLNISRTVILDITPIINFKNHLISFIAFDCNFYIESNLASKLMQLTNLRILDLSVEKNAATCNHQLINDILLYAEAFPQLIELDLSGIPFVNTESLYNFVRYHHQLIFLGLVLTYTCYDDVFTTNFHNSFPPWLTVAGTATEEQLCTAFRRYISRKVYMQECLRCMSLITIQYQETRPDILRLIFPIMETHTKQFYIQLYASACIYNLTKDDSVYELHHNFQIRLIQCCWKARQIINNYQEM